MEHVEIIVWYDQLTRTTRTFNTGNWDITTIIFDAIIIVSLFRLWRMISKQPAFDPFIRLCSPTEVKRNKEIFMFFNSMNFCPLCFVFFIQWDSKWDLFICFFESMNNNREYLRHVTKSYVIFTKIRKVFLRKNWNDSDLEVLRKIWAWNQFNLESIRFRIQSNLGVFELNSISKPFEIIEINSIPE